jgi:hypothetical protein
MFLSVQFLHFAQTENCVQIDGVGLLHSIWVFRHHPQLDTLLKQVKHPTNLHLRQAGMLRTRLAGPSSNGQERSMIGLESETDYEPVVGSDSLIVVRPPRYLTFVEIDVFRRQRKR